MSGRTIQLARQLRKLREVAGGSPSPTGGVALHRATQLALELALEHTGTKDGAAAFKELAARAILDDALAERLITWIDSRGSHAMRSEHGPGFDEVALPIGRDLDRLLRSLELGALAPELPFAPLHDRASAPAPASSSPRSVAAVNLSGRVLELEARGGLAVVRVDGASIPMTLGSGERAASFSLAKAPTSRADVARERSGVVRMTWATEGITLELAADFASVRIAAIA